MLFLARFPAFTCSERRPRSLKTWIGARMSLFRELKRRNVFRVGIAYAVAAWVILQLTDVIGEIMELPDWGGKLILLLLITGFIPALIFAWAFEMTPEGVKREKDVDRTQSVTSNTGRKLDFAIIGLLAIGLVYFIYEARFKEDISPDVSAETSLVASEPDSGSSSRTDEQSESDPGPISDINEKSIAVLPFTNRSPNQDDIYFTDGVHDDLLTQLAKLDTFSVISRTSVMEYRDTEKKIGVIADELGVANIMEGAVQRAGNQVRINVQLIDAATDEHLWAEVYDRELTTENLFQIQSEIARNIAEALHSTLTEEQIATVAEAPTDNVEAYEMYQQARRFALGESEIGFDTSIELYKQALRLDPEFKLAWIGLARAHITNYWQYGGNPQDRQNSREAIDRAREIDPDFPELFLAEGFYWYWGHLDYDRAIDNLERALALMPGNAEAHMWLGWATRRDGQWERAIASMAESVRLNPRIVVNWMEYAGTMGMVGRSDEALALGRKGAGLEPDNYWGKSFLAELEIQVNGDLDRALTLIVGAQHTGEETFLLNFINYQTMARHYETVFEAINLMDDEAEIDLFSIFPREDRMAVTHWLAGDLGQAKIAANSALQGLEAFNEQAPGDYRVAQAQARMHAILGNPDEVRRLLQYAQENKPVDAVNDADMRWDYGRTYAMAGLTTEAVAEFDYVLGIPGRFSHHFLELEPYFDNIRETREFQALLEKHGK
jgi:TolB-like protein